jgi:MFS family permease
MALAIGKRPVYIASISMAIIYPFVLPHIHKYSAWIGMCFANGVIMSPLFVLPEISIADTLFYHERGLPMGIYVATTYGGALFAPIVSGYVYDGLGWHGPPYLCGGLNAITAIFLFVFLEETNFKRHIQPTTTGTVETAVVEGKNGEKTETKVKVVEETHVHAWDRIVSPWPGPRPLRIFTFSKHAFGILIRGLLQPIAMLCLPVTIFCGLLFGIYQSEYPLGRTTCAHH